MEELNQEGVLAIVFAILGVVLLVALAVYIVTSIFLNSLNKKIYGKGTALAWIPYAKTFLLGKLAFNKLIGLIYLGASIVIEILAGATENSNGFFSGLSSLLGIGTIVLYVFAIIRNGKLKRGELNPADVAQECESMNFPSGENKSNRPADPAMASVQPRNNPPVVNEQPAAPVVPVTEEQPQAPVETKYCPDCGSALDGNAAFCTNCGKQL